MEQDCVVGLYQYMGRAVGEPFSAEDVSQLFGKVFHEPSNAEEVQAAITKISSGNRGWTCAGQNVLDVLREMEHQRVKSEKLYWERQMVNAVNYHSPPAVTDTPVICDPYTLHHEDTQRDCFQISNRKNISSANMGLKKTDWSMSRLRKAHRQSWARLVVEGLHSLLPAALPRPALQIRGQAWGCVSVSDILLLAQVKYDVVSSLLYTEMLREHYSADVWESLSPWEQRDAEEGLGDGADQGFESHDLLHLAQLPGAFSMCRFQDQCWSAVSFLSELNTLCQLENNSLEVLAHRLSRDSLRLVCLYIRLATVRAQRQKQSYGAVLEAQQSWECWPDVHSPKRAELAALLLQSKDHEHKVEPVSETPQQALLQLLVLAQEQERRQLIKMLQAVSHKEIQELAHAAETPKEENNEEAADLRAVCVRRLQQIYSSLKSQTQSEPRVQDCGLQLLMDLLRLQEVQVSVLLPTLLDMNPPALLSLLEDLRCSLQTHCLPNLLQLLSMDQPTEPDQCNAPQPSRNAVASAEEQSRTPRDTEPSRVSVQAKEAPPQLDACTGCGAAMAGLPYLEVLGASDPIEGTREEPGNSPVEASLITLAWSKTPNPDCPAEREDWREVGQQPNETSLQQTTYEANAGEQIQYCNTEQISPHGSISEDENRVQVLVTEDLLTSSTNSSSSEEQVLHHERPNDLAVTVENEDLNAKKTQEMIQERRAEKFCSVESVSAVEREQTMRSLVDLQRKVEQRQQRDRERQLLKVQERLSIIQSRKAVEDQLSLKDRLKLLTHNLPQEDIQQQKAVVKERLEQLRRERSYILQSKRDKNTAGFKELLGPVGLHHTKIKEDAD